MVRKFSADTLVVASHNAGKVREIRELLVDYVTVVISAKELDLLEPEETETTFIGNAVLKARAAAIASGHVCLADDSGLCVAALDDQPGIFSARWAGPTKDFNIAIANVLAKLNAAENTDRSAYFSCALALAWPDRHSESFEGRIYGQIVDQPKGEHGFGYDPIFMPVKYDITFAEMDPAHKHRISHRANAFKKLVYACFKS